MSKKKLFTLKRDITDTYFSTPKTPVKKVVYRDMIDSSVVEINIPSDDIFTSCVSNKNNDIDNDKYKDIYMNDHKIGEGDFFTVYKNVKDNKITAIKKSKKPIKNTLDFEFYNREVNMLKSIESLYVTKYINSFIYNSYFFIEVEYCNGGNLRDYINKVFFLEKGSISTEIIRKIMCDVGKGLNDIHNKGIVHLDIKPENIFIQNTIYKIGDMGISTRVGEDITLDGDKRYMAQEVLRNICTPSSDIYSLGLIYIEILRGINLPKKGEAWLKLRKNNFKGIDMDIISRKMLYGNYKKRCSIEEVIKYFSQ